MKEATDSEYAISQKLAYETRARRGLEVEFEVVLKSLQSDQITITGYEVELNDLKGASNYAMDCIAVPAEGEEAKSIMDRLIDTPNRLLTLLKAASLAAATDALVRVKSHYLAYGPPWAHYLGGYLDRLLDGPLGLPDLCRTVPVGMRSKDHDGEVLG
jgi:hypothetical protein